MDNSKFVNNKEVVNNKIFERNFINIHNHKTITDFQNFPYVNSSDKYIKNNESQGNNSIFNNRIIDNENNNKLAKVGFINFNHENEGISFDKRK